MRRFMKTPQFVMVPCVIAALLLLAGMAKLPWGYYTFLRWAVAGVSVWAAVAWGSRQSVGWVAVMAGAAVLFNPFEPFRMSKESWASMDFLVAAIMAASAWDWTHRLTSEREEAARAKWRAEYAARDAALSPQERKKRDDAIIQELIEAEIAPHENCMMCRVRLEHYRKTGHIPASYDHQEGTPSVAGR